ncbi:uncharacterized protein BX663DRAFT_283580 [Cokeromyces recurvatus]|uniref:uncharacterized protein n=1 Tax=Cokeromyces recurvatus TaxID=90255 RepID=UPI00221F286E|nr:uncharacterized protein BX663DRAFT_283580 [Cokeromyces recurvatus]KAI7905474.1 hypothetical protein BX663DRAFT_283580 [Cokeromyces recurvatus]
MANVSQDNMNVEVIPKEESSSADTMDQHPETIIAPTIEILTNDPNETSLSVKDTTTLIAVETITIPDDVPFNNNHTIDVKATTKNDMKTTEATKVTSIQRLSAAYNKARRSIVDIQKTFNEKIHSSTVNITAADNNRSTTKIASFIPTVRDQVANNETRSNGATLGNFIVKIKSFSKLSDPNTNAENNLIPPIIDSVPPIPPPKDNIQQKQLHPSASGSSTVNQPKRNSTLLSSYFSQKKKEIGEEQQTATPEAIHGTTGFLFFYFFLM